MNRLRKAAPVAMKPLTKMLALATVVLVGLMLTVTPITAIGGEDGSNAANKVAAAASEIEILSPQIDDGFSSVTVPALSVPVKMSPGMDLILSLTMECALWTNLATTGNDAAESMARVIAEVLIDGVAVPISSETEQTEVVFCDRVQQTTTSDFDDQNAKIENFMATRSANAFNWIALDLEGQAGVPHTVDVIVQLVGEVQGTATTQAGIGARSLIVEPVQLPVGSQIGSGL
jgi:hypothetical protein